MPDDTAKPAATPPAAPKAETAPEGADQVNAIKKIQVILNTKAGERTPKLNAAINYLGAAIIQLQQHFKL